MNSTTKVSLEEIASLYKAAWQQKQEGDWAITRVRECMDRHGFRECDVRRAAGILPHQHLDPTPRSDLPASTQEDVARYSQNASDPANSP